MNVLHVASECAPFVKTGGLADVVGAVPKALVQLGVTGKVLLPLYPALTSVAVEGREVWSSDALHGGPARLVAVQAEEIDLLLLEAPHLYERGGSIYQDETGADWPDNALRFAALSQVAAIVAADGVEGWAPDLVHAHDWQAGLVPVYLHQTPHRTPPCVMTIHNIAFQGLCSPDLLDDLYLSPELYSPDGIEFYGNISFLKAGLVFAEGITTVSPTYAREIMDPAFGMGMEGVLKARQADVSGILNGIDLDAWDPETDANLAQTFTAKRLKAKSKNRQALLDRFALSAPEDAPLFCVITRLTTQKGVDVLLDALPSLLERGARLVVLGSGDKGMEAAFVAAAHRWPGQIGVVIGYDEALSHLMQGGSDAILVPSRFEPCGLTQLYGLRYGTIPVVSRTGGLADTVVDANEAAIAADCATGVQFSPVTSEALAYAISRTCDLFADRKRWAGMMRRGMRHPVGWETSAAAYHAIYTDLIAA